MPKLKELVFYVKEAIQEGYPTMARYDAKDLVSHAVKVLDRLERAYRNTYKMSVYDAALNARITMNPRYCAQTHKYPLYSRFVH